MEAQVSPKVSSIRVSTQLRTSQHPDGVSVSVEVLKPLSSAERKAGKKDEFGNWIRRFGDGSSRKSTRGRHPSDWWDQKPKKEKPHANVDESVQLEILKTMAKDFERMAVKLVSQSHIAVSDKEFFEGRMFAACRDAYPKFDPEKRSLRGFMKDVIRKWRSDYLDFLNTGKRKEDFMRLSIRPGSVDDETSLEEPQSAPETTATCSIVSEESIPDPRSVAELEFNLALGDLEEMCDDDERLALHVLYGGGTVEDVAVQLDMNPSYARRHVVGSLQLKVDYCFGFSENHHLKFILHNR